MAFFCEYKTQRGRHRCSYVGLVPVGRNVRMFLEYLNYVVHVLPIAQERKTHKIAQKDFLTQEGFLGRFYTPVATKEFLPKEGLLGGFAVHRRVSYLLP